MAVQAIVVPTALQIEKYSLVHHMYNFRSEDVDLEKEFEQNELNSAVYLISIAMQISNFAVNYKVGFVMIHAWTS